MGQMDGAGPASQASSGPWTPCMCQIQHLWHLLWWVQDCAANSPHSSWPRSCAACDVCAGSIGVGASCDTCPGLASASATCSVHTELAKAGATCSTYATPAGAGAVCSIAQDWLKQELQALNLGCWGCSGLAQCRCHMQHGSWSRHCMQHMFWTDWGGGHVCPVSLALRSGLV